MHDALCSRAGRKVQGEVRHCNATRATVRHALRDPLLQELPPNRSIPSPGPLATTKGVAQDGLIRHQAEFYQITDDETGKQVAIARNGGRREEQDEP
jgi:hypothetical protein